MPLGQALEMALERFDEGINIQPYVLIYINSPMDSIQTLVCMLS